MNIAINPFVTRQTPNSRFSHYQGPIKDVVEMVKINWARLNAGYRPGVVLVQVPHKNFYSSTCLLKPGDKLVGGYEARKPGETPRKFTAVQDGKKIPAARTDIVLYSSQVLAEDGDNVLPANPDNWEIISINCSPTEDVQPIPVGALIDNHLQLDGGTDTKMTDEQFVAQLRKSVLYWQDKGNCA